jgi:hypothetical protein
MLAAGEFPTFLAYHSPIGVPKNRICLAYSSSLITFLIAHPAGAKALLFLLHLRHDLSRALTLLDSSSSFSQPVKPVPFTPKICIARNSVLLQNPHC